MPKKGFKSKFHKLYTVVNVATLERHFEAGETVDAESLYRKGLVGDDLEAGLKILGNGEISKSLVVKATAFSDAAKAKIEAAGGSCDCL
jgi:large subunit ribosomal protein L15